MRLITRLPLSLAATLLLVVWLGYSTHALAAPPPTADGSITFDAPNASNTATKSGTITVTATKKGLKPKTIKITVPVSVNMSMKAVAASVKFLAPASWQSTILAADSSLVFKQIEKLDGDPGKTGVKMHWAVDGKIPVTTTSGKKIKVKKTPGGGRAGQFNLAAAGVGTNSVGEFTIDTAIAVVWFDPQDSAADIMARIAGKLEAQGWGVDYDATLPEELTIHLLPSGIEESSVSLAVAYSDEVTGDAEYHWEVGFPGADDGLTEGDLYEAYGVVDFNDDFNDNSLDH